jgi:hypothetical protein
MLWFCSNFNLLLILSWDSDTGINPNHASTCKRNITLLQTFSNIIKHLYLSQWLLEWQSFLLSSVDSASFNSTACNTSCRRTASACLWTQSHMCCDGEPASNAIFGPQTSLSYSNHACSSKDGSHWMLPRTHDFLMSSTIQMPPQPYCLYNHPYLLFYPPKSSLTCHNVYPSLPNPFTLAKD